MGIFSSSGKLNNYLLHVLLGTVNKQLLSCLMDFVHWANALQPALFLINNIKMDRIPTKFKWKRHALFTLYFKFLNIYIYFFKNLQQEMQSPLVFISFYIRRYHFSQRFRTSFNTVWKKDFSHKFSLLADSLNPPRPPPTNPFNSQNLLSVTKAFRWCSLSQLVVFRK